MSGRQQKEIQKLRSQLAEVQPLLEIVRSGQLEVIKETIEVAQYSGPIPDPRTLQEYNNASSGFADDIRRNFLEESRHRREMEKREQAFAHKMFNRQSWLPHIGMLIAVLALGALCYLAYFLANRGYAWQATSVIASVATIIGVFVYGSRGIRNDVHKQESDSSSTKKSNLENSQD